MTVDYATSNGTGVAPAVAPGDYTTTTGTLTFDAGVSSLTFLIPIVNDTEGEGPETVNLTCRIRAASDAGRVRTAVLTLNDDESTMQFAALEFVGLEGTLGGVVTVTRTGSLIGTATVRYMATDDTATVLRDYTSPTGVVTFPPGVASKTFTVPITDGSVLEQDEFVTLTLSNPTTAVSVIRAWRSSASVTTTRARSSSARRPTRFRRSLRPASWSRSPCSARVA